MKWILIVVIWLPGTNSDSVINEYDFKTEAQCEAASEKMVRLNAKELEEANKLGIPVKYSFAPIGCLFVER